MSLHFSRIVRHTSPIQITRISLRANLLCNPRYSPTGHDPETDLPTRTQSERPDAHPHAYRATLTSGTVPNIPRSTPR